MNVNLSKQIQSLDGKDLTVAGGEPATVKKIAANALMNSSAQNYEEKSKLAKKILSAEEDEITLKAEEISTIKNAVKEVQYTAQLVYQFEQAIDPTEDE